MEVQTVTAVPFDMDVKVDFDVTQDMGYTPDLSIKGEDDEGSPIDDPSCLDSKFPGKDSDDEETDKLKLSPTETSASSVPSISSVPRRPPRKSTLTQQQKNQKRQRATQEQLNTLEDEFNKNPTPNAIVRERIAQEINMTERSVQIWFQNRRAKIKNLAKRSIENGEECDAIPESMRTYLARQALESGKPLVRADFLANGGMPPWGSGLLLNTESAASKVMIYHLSCRSLSIGTWRRLGQTQLDLVVFYSPTKSMMTYYIQAENTGFRIEYPFSNIKDLTYDGGDVSANAEGASQQTGNVVIELFQPPTFTMDQGSKGWFQCRDFTEDLQASRVLTHHLGGHPKVLSTQVSKLLSLDAYKNRHNIIDPNQAIVSAPVSPVGHRPSSQPNHIVHPHSGTFQDQGFAMGPPPPRGHKRQRSRSVPAAMDFSQRRPPMPPFIMHQHQHHHVHQFNAMLNSNNSNANANPTTPNANPVYAPVPQHPQPPHFPQANALGPVGPNLNIDTAAGYGFDFTPAPLSATTATTPPSSEFESSMYAPNLAPDNLSAPALHTPFNGSFLSPMVDSSNLLDPSVSPLSAVSQPDYQVSNDPPHYSLHRSASADPTMFQHDRGMAMDANAITPRDKQGVYDGETLIFDEKSHLDALLIDDPLVDPFSKQPLTLPFRPPMDMHFQQQHQPQVPPSGPPPPMVDDFEFHHLVRLDPSSLSPEYERPAFLA